MTDVFPIALEFVLDKEGEYSNDDKDAGGETYCGISRVYHPSWEGWQIIDDIKQDYSLNSPHFIEQLDKQNILSKVNSFYKKNFWEPLLLSKIENNKIAIKLFEMAVNIGIPRTANLVQTCLNLMSYGIYYELKVDNIIGNITVHLINEMTKKDDGDFLLKLLTLQQGHLYMKIAQNNPAQKKFIHGWINRLGIKLTGQL